ncbi:MAG: PrsW family intramembrane metalloprotease [Pyrinomonadaceae bacterium]
MNNQPLLPNQPIINSGIQKKPLSRRKIIKWLLLTASILVGLLLLVLILALDTLEVGIAALFVGMIAATLPVPLYTALILWIDRFEHEPRYLLFACFLWGATASIFIAMLVNTTVQITAGRFASTVISAPIIEEIAKAIVIFAIFFVKRDEFNGILDGIIYAAITALGFALVENFSYYGRAFAGLFPGVGIGGAFFVRGIQSPFLHPFFTSMTGIGLGWAAQTRNGFIRVLAPLVGLGLAIFFHSLWNFSAVLNISNIIYFILMAPALAVVLVIAGFALRREKRIISGQLLGEVTAGRLTQTEYEHLTSLHRRCAGSFRALFSKGLSGWSAQRRCNQAASELALQRHRAAEGNSVDTARLQDCETAFAEFLQQTRQV